MTREARALLILAKENPWWQFNGKEIAMMCNVSEDTLTKMRAFPDNPFSAGRSRPEKVSAWLAAHPGWQPSKG